MLWRTQRNIIFITIIFFIIGGKLNFDAYNNGGEWIDSVFDVGPDLVRKNAWTIISLSSSWDLCMQRTSIGKRDTSLEMGRHSSLCHSVGQKKGK